MAEIKVKIKNKCCASKKKFKASDMAFGQLFMDCDGDLYLRVEGGAIFISDEDEAGDEAGDIGVYSTAEIYDIEEWYFFEECRKVNGKVKLTVTLI
jgi:hypothetical protein